MCALRNDREKRRDWISPVGAGLVGGGVVAMLGGPQWFGGLLIAIGLVLLLREKLTRTH